MWGDLLQHEWVKSFVRHAKEYATGVKRCDRHGCVSDEYLDGYVYGSKTTRRLWCGGCDETTAGIYNNDMLSGPGKKLLVNRDGSMIYSRGIYKDGILNGRGEMEVLPPVHRTTSNDAEKILYKGVFVNDRLHGSGTISSLLFTVYGEFRHGRFHSGSIVIHKYTPGLMAPQYKQIKSMKGEFGVVRTCTTEARWFLSYIPLTSGRIINRDNMVYIVSGE
jgi:hypothetical protein